MGTSTHPGKVSGRRVLGESPSGEDQRLGRRTVLAFFAARARQRLLRALRRGELREAARDGEARGSQFWALRHRHGSMTTPLKLHQHHNRRHILFVYRSSIKTLKSHGDNILPCRTPFDTLK